MRLKKYYNLSKKLNYMSNEKLKTLLQSTISESEGWGENKIIEIDGIKIFCKKIPVANLFAKKQFETENLYSLPMYYNYGIGSSGFSPWRELLLHIKTTNFVLSEEMENFPLLYHYRIIDENVGEIDRESVEEKVKIWNNNQNITKYLEDRELSSMKIIMFFEYIEHNLSKALSLQKISYTSALSQAFQIIKFLNDNDILHMDSHPYNYLVDNNGKLYLSDFGISIDKEFNLSSDEILFMKNNSSYDYALTLQMLSFNSNEYKIMKENGFNKRNFFENLDEMKILLNIDDDRFEKIVEYKNILSSYINFILELRDLPNKAESKYPNQKIKKLLILPQLGGNCKQKFIKYCEKNKKLKKKNFG
jgi:serine/threonine protein kinase